MRHPALCSHPRGPSPQGSAPLGALSFTVARGGQRCPREGAVHPWWGDPGGSWGCSLESHPRHLVAASPQFGTPFPSSALCGGVSASPLPPTSL